MIGRMEEIMPRTRLASPTPNILSVLDGLETGTTDFEGYLQGCQRPERGYYSRKDRSLVYIGIKENNLTLI
jgi:hypothetical protein